MKTVVVGAGAMGSLFGGLLAEAGEDVWLVDLRKAHVAAMQERGLVIEDDAGERTIPVQAAMDVSQAPTADLVVLFVKTYHTEQAMRDALALRREGTVFLTLQNGLGNEEVLCRFVPPGRVLVGVTLQGATLLAPGRIRHAGRGKTYLGLSGGGVGPALDAAAALFNRGGIPTTIVPDIRGPRWEKLAVNVGINALAAVTGLKNGELLDSPETTAILETLVLEAAAVARAQGVVLEGDLVARVTAVAEATRENRCSMGQDLDRQEPTEIDAINGALVREAERWGVAVPCNRVMTGLVRAIERVQAQRQRGGTADAGARFPTPIQDRSGGSS